MTSSRAMLPEPGRIENKIAVFSPKIENENLRG